MVYGLLGCQSLVLIHLHQTSNQILGCQGKIREETQQETSLTDDNINITGLKPQRDKRKESFPRFEMFPVSLQQLWCKSTWIRDLIPVRWVKLIVACENLSEQVLVMVFIIIIIRFIIERRVTWKTEKKRHEQIWVRTHSDTIHTISMSKNVFTCYAFEMASIL